MERNPYQYSLSSLLVLTTVCAVLLSFWKTFPRASAFVVHGILILAGPLLLGFGSFSLYCSDLFFGDRLRFRRIWGPVVGLLCMTAGIALILLLH